MEYIAGYETEEKQQREAARIVSNIDGSKSAMTQLNLFRRLQENQQYYDFEAPIKCRKYNEFRYSRTFEDIETFTSILTAGQPRFDFEGREFSDYYLEGVMNDLADYVLDQGDFDLSYAYGVKDSLLNASSFVELELDRSNKLTFVNHQLATTILGDWTEKDIWKQPFIGTVKILDFETAREMWGEDIVDEMNPGDGMGLLEYLKRIRPMFENLAGLDRVFDKKDMQNKYKAGKLVCLQYMDKHKGRVRVSYVVNGKFVQSKYMRWPEYPIVKMTFLPRLGDAIGKSITDITKHDSDAITVMVQNYMRNQAAVAGAIFLYPEGSGVAQADIEKAINSGIAAIPVDPRYFQMAQHALIPVKRESLNPGMVAGMEMIFNMAERKDSNSRYVQGLPVSGEDSGSKVSSMQQAGVGRIRTQSRFFDMEFTKKVGKLVLFYIQNMMTEKKIFRVVGQTNEDGSPKFTEINIKITRDELMQMMKTAFVEGQPTQAGMMVFTPDQLRAQIELLSDKKLDMADMESYLDGSVPTYKLLDTSIAEFDLTVRNSDAMAYDKAKQESAALALFNGKAISLREVRKAFRYKNDPAGLKAVNPQPTMGAEEYLKAMQENPPGTPEHEQLMMQMIQDIGKFQAAVA